MANSSAVFISKSIWNSLRSLQRIFIYWNVYLSFLVPNPNTILKYKVKLKVYAMKFKIKIKLEGN